MENGKLLPYYGSNYAYFDKTSYTSSRAFTSDKVAAIILDAYKELEKEVPERHFYLMEMSNEHGGQLFPHRTHQNGLSADFMLPKLKDGKAYYGLDTLGTDHYFLDFNDEGQYKADTTISIDFNLVAQHIFIINDVAKKNNYKISKVIIKLEYKDELFSTFYGKKLKESGIYIVQNLTPLINKLHDDHFHLDFQEL